MCNDTLPKIKNHAKTFQIMVVFQKIEGKTTTLKIWIQKFEGKNAAWNFEFKRLKEKTLLWKFDSKIGRKNHYHEILLRMGIAQNTFMYVFDTRKNP